jgi:hypothetical protein
LQENAKSFSCPQSGHCRRVFVSTKKLDERPGRWEPRMQMKRPKQFPFLDRRCQEYKNMHAANELAAA